MLFNASVEELFAGPRAEEAKVRALNIANVFEFRLRGRGPLSLLWLPAPGAHGGRRALGGAECPVAVVFAGKYLEHRRRACKNRPTRTGF